MQSVFQSPGNHQTDSVTAYGCDAKDRLVLANAFPGTDVSATNVCMKKVTSMDVLNTITTGSGYRILSNESLDIHTAQGNNFRLAHRFISFCVS